jgi:DNA-directed RNA polymerase specialized sigma24 family protein
MNEDRQEKELRIELQTKNNVLHEAIFSRWGSVAEMARELKLSGYVEAHIRMLLTLKRSPKNKRDGTWTTTATALSTYLRIPEDTLFPAWVYSIKKSFSVLEMSKGEVALASGNEAFALPAPEEHIPEEEVSRRELRRNVMRVLSTLTPREQYVISERFGLNDSPGPDPEGRTFADIGETLGVCGERVRAVEAKALKKLRHPARAQYLEAFIEREEVPNSRFRPTAFLQEDWEVLKRLQTLEALPYGERRKALKGMTRGLREDAVSANSSVIILASRLPAKHVRICKRLEARGFLHRQEGRLWLTKKGRRARMGRTINPAEYGAPTKE